MVIPASDANHTPTSPSEMLLGEKNDDPADLRPPLIAGAVIIGIFFFALGGWATFAPLNSAAIAQGTVIVESNRKIVQHFEGGIVGNIYIKDGDAVMKGEVLIRLDETQPKANLELLYSRKMSSSALAARLKAERDKKEKIIFSAWLTSMPPNKKNEIVQGQESIFVTRKNAINGQISVLKQGNKQFQQQIIGLKNKINSEDYQLSLIDEELKDLTLLVSKGFARKPRLLTLQRERSTIEGSRGQNIADVARIKQSIIETGLRVIELRGNFFNQAAEELSKVRSELLDLDEQIISAKDILLRLDIRAPIDGIVMGLSTHTIGGVIMPGEKVLDLVPNKDRLIVEARINPIDIDKVQVGLDAQVRFTAFSQRNSVPVDAKVIFVSADGIVDEKSLESYYLAKITLNEGFKTKLGGETVLPGMQVEVLIITGEQTPLSYLFNPIAANLNRAWRE
jgi:HlyD family type I secretion membrane fusion protein